MSLTKAAANDRHGGRSLEIVSEDSYGIETEEFRTVKRNEPEPVSKAALKKQEKAKRKDAALAARRLEAETKATGRAVAGFTGASAGKAGRAREAKRGGVPAVGRSLHRAAAGAPIMPTSGPLRAVVEYLENKETAARIRGRPELLVRAGVPMDCHGTIDLETLRDGGIVDEAGMCSEFRGRAIREFSSDLLPPGKSISNLDLSRNELWQLPGLGTPALTCVTILDLSRNWFDEIPGEIGLLQYLSALDMRHNMLRPSASSLNLAALQSLDSLRSLDLRFNQKCGKQTFADRLGMDLPRVDVRVTVTYPAPKGTFDGESAADRDPRLLRSQLEPWGTSALRRRLIADFGMEPGDPDEVPRGDVMRILLEHYAEEGLTTSREHIRISGTPVCLTACEAVYEALQRWSQGGTASGANRERPSINAESYMILRSPAEFQPGSRLAEKAAAKLAEHREIWDLASNCLQSVDPEYALHFSALAVTRNFRGSPHIDKQNVGPFYGLSLGDFPDGQGCIAVECSARVVALVDTKNKLGKVDGRFPHWVTPYEGTERFSLIFYQTTGNMQPTGPAIFARPSH